jgi:hypothetical protein
MGAALQCIGLERRIPVLAAAKGICGENGRRLNAMDCSMAFDGNRTRDQGTRSPSLYRSELRSNSGLTAAKMVVNPQGFAPCSTG